MRKVLFCFIILGVSGCSVYNKPVYLASDKRADENSVIVKVIAERQGQILRNNLLSLIRDYPSSLKNCIIEIKLSRTADGVLLDNTGTANRLLVGYSADITVSDKSTLEKIWEGNIKMDQSTNISKSSGEIMLSLYSEYESYTIKRLARRIFEDLNIKLRGKNENKNGK